MPKLPEANQFLKDQRRHRLLSASLSVFAELDYAKVSIEPITKKARCTRSLFYHYFKDKKELFSALIEETILPSKTILNLALIEGENGIEYLCEYFAKTAQKDAKSLWIAKVLLRYPLEEAFAKDFPKFAKERRLDLILAKRLKQSQKEGRIIAGPIKEIVQASLALFQYVLNHPGEISSDVLFNLLSKGY